MEKRGQVAVFVVVGLVIIIVMVLLFTFKDKLIESVREQPADQQMYLQGQLKDIKDQIGDCADKETKEAAKLLMKNGGYFEKPFNYITYSNLSYPILCRKINGSNSCLSEPVLTTAMVLRLQGYLPKKLNRCINLEDFRNKDYVLTSGNLTVEDIKIFEDSMILKIKVPIKLTKGSYSAQASSFSYELNIPLGGLTNSVNKLVQTKANGTEINTLTFTLFSMNKYIVHVRKPYPDELYDVTLGTGEDYHFYFAIEGIGRFERGADRIR